MRNGAGLHSICKIAEVEERLRTTPYRSNAALLAAMPTWGTAAAQNQQHDVAGMAAGAQQPCSHLQRCRVGIDGVREGADDTAVPVHNGLAFSL